VVVDACPKIGFAAAQHAQNVQVAQELAFAPDVGRRNDEPEARHQLVNGGVLSGAPVAWRAAHRSSGQLFNLRQIVA
jgi:hypothetical protein